MSVRSGIVAVIAVGLGVVGVACSGAGESVTEPSSSPTRATETRAAEPLELATSAPSVSWLRVSPELGAARSPVSLDVACLDNLGAVNSPVLDIGPLQGNPDGHQPWRLFGSATVRSDAVAGRYRISATCGASELSAGFTVVSAPSR